MRRLTRDEFWGSSTQTSNPDTWPIVGSSGHTLPPTVSSGVVNTAASCATKAQRRNVVPEPDSSGDERHHLDDAIPSPIGWSHTRESD